MQVTAWKYKVSTSLNVKMELLTCDDEVPPEYLGSSITQFCRLVLILAITPLCEIEVNLRDLPLQAFSKFSSANEVCYSVDFELAIVFGPAMEIEMHYKGKMISKALVMYN